jgi:hypothetical protein
VKDNNIKQKIMQQSRISGVGCKEELLSNSLYPIP